MAVRFSASGQSYSRTLTLSTQAALTVCGWFKVSVDRNDYSSIFFIDNGTSDNWGMQTGADGTTMSSVFDASTQQGIGSMTVGTWYFIALSTSGTTGNIYYRTAAQSALTTVAVTSVTASVNAATLRIGDSPWGAEWFNGVTAALKGWNAALTANETLQESMQYQPGRVSNLLFLHPFVKAETADYSGNARTLSGGTGATTEDGPPIPWIGYSPKLIHQVSSGSAVALAGHADAAAGATGQASVDRPIAAVASAASGASGSLSATRAVDGAATAAGGFTGVVSAARPVAGVSAAASGATGTQLDRVTGLGGNTPATAGATGDVGVSRAVAAHGDAASGGSGVLGAARTFAGVSAAAADATGDLTKQGQTALDGAASASSGAAGSLTLTVTLAAVSAAASGVTGDLSKQGLTDLGGVGSAASGASGSMRVTEALAAVGAVSAGGSGDLSIHGPTLLDGAAATASGASGALSLTLTLTAVIPASSGGAGTLARGRPLNGSAPAATAFTAALQVVGAVTFGQMTHTDRDTATMTPGTRGAATMTGG